MEEDVHREELDGVPVFWAEAPGPPRMSIQFRVGRADETLATAGLTHLVEHLALFALEDDRQQRGGFTNHLRTVFFTSGLAAELVEFANLVSRSLTSLPLDRIELETSVLLTESASAGRNSWQRLMGLRFGAAGFGLVDYLELGLRRFGYDEPKQWAEDRFVAENAAVWLSGPPPDDFALPLPRGRRHAAPDPETMRGLQTPAYLATPGGGGVAISFLAPRSTALTIALALLEERLRRSLRIHRGMTYAITGSYEPLDAGLAHVMLAADCLDEHAVVVRDELLEEVRRLAAEAPDADEISRATTPRLEAMLQDPWYVYSELDAAVGNELMGAQHFSRAELRQEYEELTPDAVARAVGGLPATAILLAPTGSAPPEGFVVYEGGKDEPLEGQRYKRRERRSYRRAQVSPIVASPDGITFVDKGGVDPITVRFADVVAVLRHGPGRLTLIARNGNSIRLDARTLQDGDKLVESIEQALTDDLFIPFDDDPAESALELFREKIGYRSLVAREGDILPGYLEPAERVVNLAQADNRLRRGLVVLTDRRLLFLAEESSTHKSRRFLEVRLGEVTGARRIFFALYHPGFVVGLSWRTRHKFSNVTPRARIDEFVHALRVGGDPAVAASQPDTSWKWRLYDYAVPTVLVAMGITSLSGAEYGGGFLLLIVGCGRLVQKFLRRRPP